MTAGCLFCRIVKGEIPAAIVAESAECLAFRDIAPQAPTHILVIPKAHYQSLNEVPDGTVMAAVTELARKVAAQEGIAQSGYRVVTNIGGDGGQSVGHLHLHVLGGRALGWPPG